MAKDPREQQKTDAGRIPAQGTGKIDQAGTPRPAGETERPERSGRYAPESAPVEGEETREQP
jgi:hypothetical protein